MFNRRLFRQLVSAVVAPLNIKHIYHLFPHCFGLFSFKLYKFWNFCFRVRFMLRHLLFAGPISSQREKTDCNTNVVGQGTSYSSLCIEFYWEYKKIGSLKISFFIANPNLILNIFCIAYHLTSGTVTYTCYNYPILKSYQLFQKRYGHIF